MATMICSAFGFLVFVSMPIVSAHTTVEYGTVGYTSVIATMGNLLPMVNGIYSDMQILTLAHNEYAQANQHQVETAEVDRVLLHIVKNNVVDVETILNVMDTEGVSRDHIGDARRLLGRNANWCTLREVVKSMGTDTYASEKEDIPLKQFCERLLMARSVPLHLEQRPDIFV